MTAIIRINMDNAAFDGDNRNEELARILRDLAKHIEGGNTERTVMDSNGNRLGTFKILE